MQEDIMLNAMRDAVSKSNGTDINSEILFKGKLYKPSEITDEIINNIKAIKFHTLTDEQSTILNSVIKKTLIELRDDGIDREIALVYDLNGYRNQKGEWLLKTTGESNTDIIDLSQDTDINHILNPAENTIVIISHNHPRNRVISYLDFTTLCRTKNIHLIVAITYSGKVSYIVKDNFDYKKYLETGNEIIKSYNGIPTDTDIFLIDLLSACEQFGIKYYREV